MKKQYQITKKHGNIIIYFTGNMLSENNPEFTSIEKYSKWYKTKKETREAAKKAGIITYRIRTVDTIPSASKDDRAI